MYSELPPDIRLRKVLQQRLESLRRAGVSHLPRPTADAKKPMAAAPPLQVAVETPSPTPRTVDEVTPPVDVPAATPAVESPSLFSPEPKVAVRPAAAPVDRVAALRVLQEEVAACTRCAHLAKTRTQTVFGVGNPHPRIVFMGEAPGFDEDKQGEPFVGAAGQLLTRIIENGMGLRRSDVYILNTLKCRPPNNRTPVPEEVANCRGFFEQQLDILQPEYIVCLGAVAAQNLLETKLAVGRLRGRFHDYRGIKVLVTYHPAYLLRNPDDKRKTWDDIKMLMRDMGMEVS